MPSNPPSPVQSSPRSLVWTGYADSDGEEENTGFKQTGLGPPGIVLPEGWHKVHDEKSGRDYYWLQGTNTVSWTPPTAGETAVNDRGSVVAPASPSKRKAEKLDACESVEHSPRSVMSTESPPKSPTKRIAAGARTVPVSPSARDEDVDTDEVLSFQSETMKLVADPATRHHFLRHFERELVEFDPPRQKGVLAFLHMAPTTIMAVVACLDAMYSGKDEKKALVSHLAASKWDWNRLRTWGQRTKGKDNVVPELTFDQAKVLEAGLAHYVAETKAVNPCHVVNLAPAALKMWDEKPLSWKITYSDKVVTGENEKKVETFLAEQLEKFYTAQGRGASQKNKAVHFVTRFKDAFVEYERARNNEIKVQHDAMWCDYKQRKEGRAD
jgi:hypothetical protein